LRRDPAAGLGRDPAQEPARALRRRDRLEPGARHVGTRGGSVHAATGKRDTAGTASRHSARLAARSASGRRDYFQSSRNKEQHMIRSSIAALTSAASILASGSGTAARPSTQALATRVLSDAPIAHRQSSEPPIPAVEHHRSAAAHPAKPMPLVRVAAANRTAVEEPDAAFYVGAAQVYPWSE